MKSRNAFTMIELLVVMAITAVLMTLIVIPIVQSFNLTRQAAAFAQAQDNARRLGERIAREISVSAGVRDNSGFKGDISISVPAYGWTSGSPIYANVILPYGKIDILKPAEGEPPTTPGTGYVNPNTGKVDPTLHAPTGQIVLPVAAGSTIVRYFIGLRSPIKPDPANPGSMIADTYNNPYDTLLQSGNGGRDNLYVLWRAEVQPFVYSSVQHKFVVNKAFFYDVSRLPMASDPMSSGESATSRQTSLALRSNNTSDAALDYPAFFDVNDPAEAPVYKTPDPDGTPDPSKAQMIQNWMDRATIVTASDHSDMIQPVFDLGTTPRRADYDGPTPHAATDAPKVIPLVQFKPTRISSEPASGQTAVRQGEETDNAAALSPDVYMTQYGEWSNEVIRVYPEEWDQTQLYPWANAPASDLYMIGRTDPTGAKDGMSVYMYSPSNPTPATAPPENTGGIELFDIHQYFNATSNYGFSEGVAAADSRSNWLSDPNAALYKALFVAYVPDPMRGKILASFGINEVGDNTKTPHSHPNFPDDDPNNLPQVPLDPYAFTAAEETARAEGPLADSGTGATWSPQDPSNQYDINRCFNRAWNDAFGMTLRPDIQRFIDLRVTPQGDGSPSPLDPTTGYSRAHIVPGSEQVFGPDQRPGPNYGHEVQYSRTTRNPGPNQYRINYVDQEGPVDYTLLGFAGPPPATYTPTDFESAVIQARYKPGYVQLNSDPNVPLPVGYVDASAPGYVDPVTPNVYVPFKVFYRFQFTEPKDVFAVDYDSRQIMSVLLTIKNFPQQGLSTAQNVTIPVTAKVRNYIR